MQQKQKPIQQTLSVGCSADEASFAGSTFMHLSDS